MIRHVVQKTRGSLGPVILLDFDFEPRRKSAMCATRVLIISACG